MVLCGFPEVLLTIVGALALGRALEVSCLANCHRAEKPGKQRWRKNGDENGGTLW